MRRLALSRAALAVLSILACSRGPAPPAALDTATDSCAWCRMSVSDPHLAAQLVAPAEEPMFFDDIGCLVDYLARSGRVSASAIAYVADHRTGAWVSAHRAVFTRNPGLSTPMGSHLLAHVDEASRQADPAAAEGLPTAVSAIFGPAGPPAGHTQGAQE